MKYIICIGLGILLIGGLCNLIDYLIAGRNGLNQFANKDDDKEAAEIGAIITTIISVYMSELFNNPWLLLIIGTIGIVFLIPFIKFLIRKDKKTQYEQNKLSRINYNIYKDMKYERYNNLLDDIDYMSGQEFEQFLINNILPYDGFENISGTPYSGDYGVDILADKNGLSCAIQCKRFNQKVSPKAIQEVVAGRKHYKCDKAIVITNSYFTENAKQLAEDNKIELLDRDYIIKMVKLISNKDNNKNN